MTNLEKRLTAGTAACLLIGIASLARAWGHPDSDVLTILATAAGWPWARGMVEGGLVWWRGRAMQASGLEHAVFVYGLVLAFA